MPYVENPIIATIDDCAGARSAIYGAVAVLKARLRLELTDADVAELRRILDAADRMHAYHLAIRAHVAAAERRSKGL
ncbi:MAG: hypothetical protein IPP13_22315 [Kouleothrix sp.]|nr:hypothetical protein [Kouleothrix sp.]